jgi:transcription elongation GreA/GreB family factor
VDQLVERYADAAAAHLRASEQGDYKSANPRHNIVEGMYRELRERDERTALINAPPAIASCDGEGVSATVSPRPLY